MTPEEYKSQHETLCENVRVKAAEIERLTHEIESYRFGLAYISQNPGCDAQTIAQQTLDANEQ